MQSRKILLLFLALLFPSCIFLFLKYFGVNKFDVPPLFQQELPPHASSCGVRHTVPYQVPDSVLNALIGNDSLIFIIFGSPEKQSVLDRVNPQYRSKFVSGTLIDDDNNAFLMKCILLLPEPFDIALVDREGRIRGHYSSADRKEVDRLITELAILTGDY